MGFELAKTAASLGAKVYLIAGPTAEVVQNKLIERIDVVSAEDMYKAAMELFDSMDIAILSAAVADYRPKHVATQKIKKKDAEFVIELEKTKDVLASLGAIKKNQFLVGFALETNDEVQNAKGKLKRKKLDMIVLNSLNDKGAGFKNATNKVSIIDKFENISEFSLKSKSEVAIDIFNEIMKKNN